MRIDNVWALVTAFLLMWSATAESATNRPVVVIPGIMGSKLCDPSGEVVWGDSGSYLESRLRQLKLQPDETLDSTSLKPCGLIDEIVIIPYVWSQTFYAPLIETLEDLGFDGENRRILVFDYDWRFSNRDNAARLGELVQDELEPGEKFDILAHSMGGLVARLYIQELGGEGRTHTLVTFGTPHRGSAFLFQRLKEGLDSWPNEWSGGLETIQSTVLSFPSVYELLPAYPECCAFGRVADLAKPDVTVEYVDIFDSKVWDRFAWLPAEFRTPKGMQFLSEQLLRAREMAAVMRKPIFLPENDTSRFIPIASAKLSTWSRVFFDLENGQIRESVKRPGDGTVSLYSATNSKIVGAPSFNDHVDVFVGEAPVETLRRVFADLEWTSDADMVSAHQFEDGSGAKVSVSLIDVSPDRQVFGKGEPGHLTVSFQGSDDLEAADLSVVTVHFRDRDGTLPQVSDESHPFGDSIVRSLGFDFVAPSSDGPFGLSVDVPGLEALDVFLLSQDLGAKP